MGPVVPVSGVLAAGESTVGDVLARRWERVVLGSYLSMVVELVRVRPLHVIVLVPAPAVVARREAGRAKTGYGDGWTPAGLDAGLRAETPRIGLRLDTSRLTAEETADAILARMAESAIA